ncbi:GlcG/HbpS family heme-binding protein [Halalkalibacterium ligniniphilum]|uniref:GlcG/HbpS family heme-binding protein n=1 Tax=Halalkalibacterium ligniniphilum TaxID=1134413 RepID=UPI00034CB3C0|nr:heme-binding protein [Halalkalibacterium ligniniphilum]
MALEKGKGLSQEDVMEMLHHAVKKAKELNIHVSVAIVDDGGNLAGFIKMDKAKLIPSQIAQNKAYTALGFGLPTADWYEKIKDNPPLLHGIVHTERMTIFGGGLPIIINDELVGGIGVSGGTSDQDIECAEAALLIFQ